MKRSLFYYQVPRTRIAQSPVQPRDHARLMVLHRKNTECEHKRFFDLPDLLRPGDVIVANNTRVFPARLPVVKETGGRAEVFLLKEVQRAARSVVWEVLVGRARPRPGMRLKGGLLQDGKREKLVAKKKMKGSVCAFEGEIIQAAQTGTWLMRFDKTSAQFRQLVRLEGMTPVPPYIKQTGGEEHRLKQSYQTVYAHLEGSVAAPTAGLHFTRKLLTRLRRKGIQIEYLTLHVGWGTFQSVTAERIEDHVMHAEWACLERNVAMRLNQARREGRRIIGVGTTSVRTLEAFARRCETVSGSIFQSGRKWVDLFVYPGYRFKGVDGMITNFHVPESTVLMLVCAFAGRKKILKAYRDAIKRKYRFFSFGDAMLILP